MSKYKVKFYVAINYSTSKVEEVIDLVDDYGIREEDAKQILEDEEELHNLYKEWLFDNIDTDYYVIDMENDE